MQPPDDTPMSFTQEDLDAIWLAAATQGGTRAAVIAAAEGRLALKLRLGADLTVVRTEWRDAAAKALASLSASCHPPITPACTGAGLSGGASPPRVAPRAFGPAC